MTLVNLSTLRSRLGTARLLSGILLAACTLTAFAQQSTTCHTCNPNYVPGNPVEGGKTLGQLSEISISLLSDVDATNMGNLYGYCMAFPGGERGPITLKYKLLPRMEKKAPNGNVEFFFLEAGCNPDNLGGARVTIAQIAAELPSDRLDHLEVVRKYFIERKKESVFAKILNAKNTSGHTTLDYLNYLVENRKFTQTQIDASADFKKYLCTHGAVYAVYGNETCDTGSKAQ